MISLRGMVKPLSPGRVATRLRRRGPLMPGISAILVKELRGRMRGRRAFVIVTIYLVVLAVIGWMLQRMNEEAFNLNNCIGCGTVSFASASVGRGIFIGLLMLQTLIVAVLAPASTSVAISGERERQTLDLLAVTPISSLAIVLGKLLSALAWVFVLVLASIPITALVFVFGGVAPDDVLRGYAILLASVVGLGSIGLFFSALLRRTGASTGMTYVVTLLLVIGSIFIWDFLALTSPRNSLGTATRPPQALLYLNPFIAEADVACGTEGGYGDWCNLVGTVMGSSSGFVPTTLPIPGLSGNGQVAIDDFGNRFGPEGGLKGFGVGAVGPSVEQTFALRDRFWPRSVAAYLGLAFVLTIVSVQLVSPTRRWRPHLAGPFRALARPLRIVGRPLRVFAGPARAIARPFSAVARPVVRVIRRRRRGDKAD
ncbi:MAG TPA: ABC transporter permease subunit [Candidatus Eisenbacteria bacterium]|nr:ABC transporter permease subunit [Candidatus Eisenbacteria bacterium]